MIQSRQSYSKNNMHNFYNFQEEYVPVIHEIIW